jgi:hypothetical protein
MTARSPDNTGTSIERGSVKEKIKMGKEMKTNEASQSQPVL